MMEKVRICACKRKGFLGWKNPHNSKYRKLLQSAVNPCRSLTLQVLKR